MGGLKLSVVIPTRDRRELVRRAIESVRAQTHPAAQVIVVDDGSRDGTARELRRNHPQITVIEQPPTGVSAARNRGIAHCAHDWIAFLDADDEWLPDKLARQSDALAAEPDARVCHTDEIWLRRGVRVNPRRRHAKPAGWIFESCLPLCCVSPSSVVIHREVFDDVGGFDESLPACEDYDLWLRVARRYPVLLVDEPLLIKHGGHADQLSRRYPAMDRFRIRALEKILATDLKPAWRRAAARVLAAKIEIYRAGAEKRGRRVEARRYAAKLERLRASIGAPSTPVS